jgi:E3 ubiquitin-protein ligase RNF144
MNFLFLEMQDNVLQVCPICLSQIDNPITLECNHLFCQKCIEKYVQTKIAENETQILCPYENCNIKINESKMESLLGDYSEDLSKYRELCSQKYEHKVSICNNCKRSCKRYQEDDLLVYCNNCDKYFCCVCKEEDCRGLPCSNTEKLKEEFDMVRCSFIWDNVKKCPRCLCVLVKEEGCAAVKCSYCKVKFCWQCRQTQKQLQDLDLLIEKDHNCTDFAAYLSGESEDEEE